MKIILEHDDDCPLGTNGLRAYWEARDALLSTVPGASRTAKDREALLQADFELEQTMRCKCGYFPAMLHAIDAGRKGEPKRTDVNK
jgi:hypothetical protein